MCTEEKIKVYAVENDTMASHVFKQIFADSKTYDFEITRLREMTVRISSVREMRTRNI